MIRHLFKTLLKKRKADLLLEFLGTFLILFIICVLVTYFISNSFKPKGFDHEMIMVLAVYPSSFNDTVSNDERFSVILPGIQALLTGNDKIIHFCEAPNRNQPYINETAYWPIKYNNRDYTSRDLCVSYADDDYADVVDLDIILGRWFRPDDNVSHYRPAVINEMLAQRVFETANPVGEIFTVEDIGECMVTGVMSNYTPHGELDTEKPIYILRNTKFENLNYNNNENCSSMSYSIGEDYGDSDEGIVFFLKTRTEDQLILESELYNALSARFQNTGIKVRRLSEFRDQYLNRKLTPIIILFVMLIFLIVNTLAGFIGVLWYNIKTRQNEIAIRMAVGASKTNVYKQFIGEMLILATLGILPGLIIAAQFPILKVFNIETSVYIMAILAATLIIYLLVALCALLPASQAAKIQPADALHEE
jgi:putative ABC transport system permease protein